MFKKKKLYRIKYRLYATYVTIIEAKDDFQALKRFKREVKKTGIMPMIISFEEVFI